MVLLTPQFLVDIKDGNNYNVYIQEELFGQIDALKNQMIAAIEKRAQELTEGWVKKWNYSHLDFNYVKSCLVMLKFNFMK